MLVKCKACEARIERDTAFKVRVKDVNTYYCNENEYTKIQTEKENRLKLLKTIDDIFGYTITNTILNKDLSEIAKCHTYTKIYQYTTENINKLEKFMSKDFSNEFGKIKYFTTILKNNIKDFIPKKEEVVKYAEIDIISSNYKPKQKKKSIGEYLTEME